MQEEEATATSGTVMSVPDRPELFFERMLANLPAAAYTCDADGLITYYNPRAVSVWGRAPELNDPVDRYCGSFRLFSADGEPIDHAGCWMALALRDEKAYLGQEIVVEQPTGKRFTVLAHANPIHDESGRLVGAINVLVDITTLKHAQAAEARLAAIVESSDDAIVSKDLEGRIGSWNRAAERMFGFTEAEAIGQPITILIPAERLEEETAILTRIQAGESIDHFETVRRRKDGAAIDVSLTISPIRDCSGRIVGASKIVREITEAKRAQKALEEQADSLATVNRVAASLAAELDLAKLLQMVTDAGTSLTRAQFGAFFYNDPGIGEGAYRLYALSGASPHAFEGYPMPRKTALFEPTFLGKGVVRSPDVTSDPRYGLNEPYEGLPDWHLPVRSYLAVPVISRSGAVLGGLFFGHEEQAVFDDRAEEMVTALANHATIAIDNARTYEESRRLNELLEVKVEQRTAQLSVLNEELEMFNYSVAHDLRGSLRGIDGFSNVLLEECGGELKADAHQYLARIQKAARRMGELLDNLLYLSSLSRAPIRRSAVDLGELSRSVLDSLGGWEPERKVEVEVASDIVLTGDAGLLRVAMENLLANAWKFTRRQPQPRIEVGRLESDGEVRYFVRDNGVGFDSRYSDRLFRPFQRLHASEEFEGTGIGLANVKRIIVKHGGRIWAQSEPGKGATFFFTMPAAVPD